MFVIPAPWRPRHTVEGVAVACTNLLVAAVYLAFISLAASMILSTVVLLPVAAAGLWASLAVCRWFAMAERSRLAALFGVEIPPPLVKPSVGGIWARFVATVRSGDRWREFGYIAFQSIWGFISFAVVLALWAPAFAGLLYGLTRGWGSGTIVAQRPDGAGWVWVAMAMSSAVWLVVVAPPLTWAVSRVDLLVGRRLLSSAEIGDPRRVAAAAEAGRLAAVSAAEEERRRIERDLHDGAQQRLIALSLNLGRARAALPDHPELARELVDSTHSEVKAVMKDLRDLVRGLRPVILEDRGLDAALSAVVARCPFPVDIIVDVQTRPPAAVESAAYFAVSEALANAMRHSGASRASVTVTRTADRLTVAVSDDGRGGAAMGADPTSGSGLAGLADRAASLGGRLLIDSPPGGGTRMEVTLPCS